MRLSRDLLAQAKHLGTKEPRRPQQASLRRSISTAYYALFHFLGEESADLLVGAGASARPFAELARRAIAHSRLKDTCGEFLKRTPKDILRPFWTSLPVSGDPDLAKICTHFRYRQARRHAADYDLSATFSRSEALDACEMAREAMRAWDDLKRSKRQVAELFALSILLWPGLSGRS